MNKTDKTDFKTFEARFLSKDGTLFIHSSIPHRNSQIKHNRKLMFLWFLKMFEGDKYFELLKVAKLPEVVLVYRDRKSSLIYPIGLANKGFALSLILIVPEIRRYILKYII